MRHGLLLLSILFLSPLVADASRLNPNNSIAPEKRAPTPYGLRIVRSDEGRTVDGDTAEFELPVAGASLGLYLESLQNAESEGGAYSADLAEPLQDMGRAFQAENKHREALEVFKRALHLSRINEGLYGETQLPALEGLISSQLATGQVLAADENRIYRYRVQQHLYAEDGPELAAATQEYSEWQRQAYLSGLGDETYLRLLDIHEVHSRDIERLSQNNETDPALVPHLYQRMRAEYLLSQYEGEKEEEIQINISAGALSQQLALNTDLALEHFRRLKDNNYRNGRRNMEQVLAVLEAQEEPDVEQLARARIALGDWYLWWENLARAFDEYEKAYQLLAQDDNAQTDPNDLFREPVELPEDQVFHPGVITAVASHQARAVVEFVVSRQGRAREIEVIALDPAGSMSARVALFNMLREVRFRPLVREGEVVATPTVRREYQFEH